MMKKVLIWDHLGMPYKVQGLYHLYFSSEIKNSSDDDDDAFSFYLSQYLELFRIAQTSYLIFIFHTVHVMPRWQTQLALSL
jgi:hypothetical protein